MIHQTLYCHVGNTAEHCRLGLFQDSDFARHLEDSKSTSGGILCIFGSRTFLFPLVGCAKKKQTSVCHRSTESEIISLDAGLRMDGILALDLWDVVIEVLYSLNNVPQTQKISSPKCKPKGAAGNCRHWVSGLVNCAMQQEFMFLDYRKTIKINYKATRGERDRYKH